MTSLQTCDAMSRHDEEDDWDDDGPGEYNPDDPETFPEGVYADDELPVVACPYCRKEMAEDCERCPHCGGYPSREDAPGESRSLFWVVMMLLALVAVVLMALAG